MDTKHRCVQVTEGRAQLAQPRFVDTALSFAARGLPVLPCIPDKKRPYIAGGTNFGNASADETQIRDWWNDYPQAWVGVATEPARLVVLDIDMKNVKDGEASLAELERELGKLPNTYSVKTPTGGRHLYFKAPRDEVIRSTAGVLGPGLDVRARGGLIIAAGPGYDVIDTGVDAPA